MAQFSQFMPYARAWNIALRTAHIAVTGTLFGGHVFGLQSEALRPWLYLVILSGAALVVVEAYPRWRWCYEGRAVMVCAKVLLLCLVPWLWNYRVPILIFVILIGSVGSHMPRRFRHYSLVERRVMVEAKSVAMPDSLSARQ